VIAIALSLRDQATGGNRSRALSMYEQKYKTEVE